ncbi:MAG: LiaF domain-containing protein [Gemmatimonadaceae bacterium]
MTPPIRYDQPAYSVGLRRTLPDHLIPDRNGVVAWWSNVKREGEWILPRHFRSFTCMGNIEIDLRSAQLAEGGSEMELNVFMGNIEVFVPPDIRVLCDGDGMLGSFDVERIGNTNPPPDAPTIRISGTAYMGSITIKVIDPNAPKWTDKLKAGWASLTE